MINRTLTFMGASKLTFYLLLFLIGSLTSCIDYKNLVYLKEAGSSSLNKYPTMQYKLRTYDNLYIKLTSLEESTMTDFNQGAGNNMQGGGGNAPAAMLYLTGYMVDEQGFIALPILGKLKVAGMSVNQVKEMIDGKLKDYVKDPSVTVKLVNYRVTVLGEVARPGVQYVFEEKWTLLQALSNAGNPTDFADLKRIKFVREEEGQIKTIYLDLTRPELISSEYFFLQPHDMIYIEPVKAKTFATNSRVASITLSTLSIILVLTNVILNNAR